MNETCRPSSGRCRSREVKPEGCRNSDLSPFICKGVNCRLVRRMRTYLTAGGFVFVSLCYLVLRWLLQFVAFRVRSHEWKELEIIVLRHELAILRRRTRRPGDNGPSPPCP